jgi:hypothetical protein
MRTSLEGYCIVGVQSLALFIFPSHKITILTVYILVKNHWKPCFMHECQMRATILGPSRYVSRLTVWIRSLHHKIISV